MIVDPTKAECLNNVNINSPRIMSGNVTFKLKYKKKICISLRRRDESLPDSNNSFVNVFWSFAIIEQKFLEQNLERKLRREPNILTDFRPLFLL